jgi:hypothetical protein
MDFIVYRTTNLVNSRYYIGCHQTENSSVFDGYLGTGKLILRAIKKNGRENFKREVLALCETQELAYELEELAVSYCLDDSLCYNLAKGGKGGASVMRKKSVEERIKRSVAAKNMWRTKREKLLAARGPKTITDLESKIKHGWGKDPNKWLRVEEIQSKWIEFGKPGYSVLNKRLMQMGYSHQNLQKMVAKFVSGVDYATDQTYQQWKQARLTG